MSIGDLATILTVAGVSIYVLGLIGLAIPIRREFTGDITTAWYAVSLVPKTVVAGQGVRIWMHWTVLFAALLLVLTMGLRFLLPVLPFDPQFSFFIAVQVVAIVIMLVFLRHIRKWLRSILSRQSGSQRNIATPFLTSVMLPLYVGLTLTVISLSIITDSEHLFLEGLPIIYPPGGNPSVFRGIVFLLIGSFFLGLPFAIWASAPLPKVRITTQPESPIESVEAPLEGWLVAHSDGFWHLFPRSPYEDEEYRIPGHRALISIADDNALVVRTLRQEDTRAEAAPEPDGLRGVWGRLARMLVGERW